MVVGIITGTDREGGGGGEREREREEEEERWGVVLCIKDAI